MELKIRFDVLSPRWLSLEQNRLTAAPTAEQSIGGVSVTFNVEEDQTQRQACYAAAALSEHPTKRDSAAETWLQTSISSLSAVFIMLPSSFRCLHSEGSLSFLRALAFFFFFFLGGSECAFPGTIFNRAPPGVAGEWLSQQLH